MSHYYHLNNLEDYLMLCLYSRRDKLHYGKILYQIDFCKLLTQKTEITSITNMINKIKENSELEKYEDSLNFFIKLQLANYYYYYY